MAVLSSDHPFSGVVYDWFCNHLSFWPAVRFLDSLFSEVRNVACWLATAWCVGGVEDVDRGDLAF